MRKNLTLSICLFSFVFILILTGCSNSKETSTLSTVSEFSNVKDALKYKGYKVNEIEPSNYEKIHSYFSVHARFIDADGNIISIYEFSNSTDAKTEAKTISKDGSTIGKNKILVASAPHFYNADNIIVGYVGDNQKFLSDLENIFGKSITD